MGERNNGNASVHNPGTPGFAGGAGGAAAITSTPETIHTYVYTASGAVITETCAGCEHKATATLIAPTSLAYDGNPKTAYVTFSSGWAGNGSAEITYTKDGTSVNTPVDAGTYRASVTLEGETAELEFTIEKKQLTVTAESKTKTYGDDDPTLTYNVTGLAHGDSLPGSLERRAGENVGKYEITRGNLDAGDNYNMTFNSATLTITPRPVKLEWSNTAFPYDGAEKTVTAKVTNAVNDNDTFTLQYNNNTASNAGTYTAKVTALGNDNYTLTGATGTEHEWSIGKVTITKDDVTLSPGSFTYTGSVQKPTVTVKVGETELVEGRDYTVTYSGDTTNVGEVTVTVTGTGNYSGTATANYTITKADQADLTITSTGPATYGQNYTLTTEGGSGDGAVTFTVSYDTGAATIEGSTLIPSKAGTVTVTATKAGGNNYNDETSVAKIITISKAKYNGSTTAVGYVLAGHSGTVTLPSIPDGASYDTPSCDSDEITGLSVVGSVLRYTGGSGVVKDTSYSVTVPVNGGNNYNGFDITVTLTGTEKQALDITGVAAASGLVYNGSAQKG